ncbi:isoprenoid synthase domain-containing protein [Podospora didyma]|uniref:Terpene synthase n=1 Tax=Podospora didyma TaxID=330526 RepID=A0AAE0P015_9PEZI|nr:isoprenoid synthase domain-containing protein [Podospora didyma]
MVNAMAPPQILLLPDFESRQKWPRMLNPHWADMKEETLEWCRKFGAFTPAGQKAFDKCNFSLLCGLTFPFMTKEQLRCSCDLMNLFFIFDEHSDRTDPAEVWEQGRVIMDALRNPEKPRPKGEWVGGEITKQFWLPTTKISTKTFQRRFIATFDSYVESVAHEAENRAKESILGFEEYMVLRRETAGVTPCFAMVEMDMDIPDEVREHPIIQELEVLAVDLIMVLNDVTSYNREQACGTGDHNMITVIMNEQHATLQEAIDWCGRLHVTLTKRYDQLVTQIPHWGEPMDSQIRRLVDGFSQWETGLVHWGFESERYYGKNGSEVRRTCKVQLLPKVDVDGKEDPNAGPTAMVDEVCRLAPCVRV